MAGLEEDGDCNEAVTLAMLPGTVWGRLEGKIGEPEGRVPARLAKLVKGRRGVLIGRLEPLTGTVLSGIS